MRKGIILAGGNGTRLSPLSLVINKQLMPVYDKPMIYYPLSILMLAGIREIMIITSSNDQNLFEDLLGNGSALGLEITYEIQKKPEGIAQAFLIAQNFIHNSPVALALGDNIFHGTDLLSILREANSDLDGANIFAYPVRDPERYGVVEFDQNGLAVSIEEKPINPLSRYAITGLYFYDKSVVEKAKKIKPSERGELEITSLNHIYLKEKLLKVKIMGRGMAWLDTGTFESMHEASTYIRTFQERQGLKISCPEEIAWRQNWINDLELRILAEKYTKSGYGKYLLNLLNAPKNEKVILKRSLSDNLKEKYR